MSRIVPIAILLFLAGCATVYPECEGDEVCIAENREYARVEWLETEFKPMVAGCYAAGYVLVYDGPQNRRLRKQLAEGQFDSWDRLDAAHIKCSDPRNLVIF